MWKNFFSSILGKVISGVILVAIGFFFSVVGDYWSGHVASPEYVNQRVEQERNALRVELKLEDQDIQRDFLDLKRESNDGYIKLTKAIEGQTLAIQGLEKSQGMFQTKVTTELSHLKQDLEEIKVDSKETNERVRDLERQP